MPATRLPTPAGSSVRSSRRARRLLEGGVLPVGLLRLPIRQLHRPCAAVGGELADLALLPALDRPGQPGAGAEAVEASDLAGVVEAEHVPSVAPRATAIATATPPARPARPNAAMVPAWAISTPAVAEPSAAPTATAVASQADASVTVPAGATSSSIV